MKITEKQLRQIIRESLTQIIREAKGKQFTNITFEELFFNRIKIVGREGELYQFIATISPQPVCFWHTDDEEGQTKIIGGSISGLVDLTKIKGAISKKQNIQRQTIEKAINALFGDFDVTGSIQTLNTTTFVFTQENNIQINAENELDGIIMINNVEIQTSGFDNEESEYEYDNEEFDEPEIDDDEQEITQTIDEPEIDDEETEITDEEPQEDTDFQSVIQQAGFYLKEDPKNPKNMRVYTKDNQWIGTYYTNAESVMAFPDIKDQAIISNLKQACDIAGIRYLK